MKKRFMVSILLLILTAGIFQIQKELTESQKAFLKEVNEKEFVIAKENVLDQVYSNIYYSYIKQEIPEMFVDQFYHNTKDNIARGLEILAIGDTETQWSLKGLVSHKVNKDGSYDVGPLQLNTNNLKSEWFLSIFAPKDYLFMEKNNFYMVTCINYFNSLRRDYNTLWEAYKVYNGGPKAARVSSPSYRITNVYAETTLNNLALRKTSWVNFFTKNLQRTIYILKFKNIYDEQSYTNFVKRSYVLFQTNAITRDPHYYFNGHPTKIFIIKDRRLEALIEHLVKQTVDVQSQYLIIQTLTDGVLDKFKNVV